MSTKNSFTHRASRRISFPTSHDLMPLTVPVRHSLRRRGMTSADHALTLLSCLLRLCYVSATALLQPKVQQTHVNIDLLRPQPIFPPCPGGASKQLVAAEVRRRITSSAIIPTFLPVPTN